MSEATRPVESPGGKESAKKALNELLSPVRSSIRLGIFLQIIGAVATVAPYVAMAELARIFLRDGGANQGEVWTVVAILVVALAARAGFGSTALSVTHFADVRLQAILRKKIVSHLGKVPLGWFTKNSSGLVRKATQNDIGDIHYLVAHGAVETTAAITVPIAGFVYLWILDWRLALLGIATLPIYLITYAFMTRGMGEKMAQMNAGIARISSTIVEFVSGISVVKTFGQAGKAHSAYRKAATEFGEAYSEWTGPMLRTDALASLALSSPVVLLVNLAVGTWLLDSGWVDVVSLITAALVATTLPVAIMTVSFSMQARREASAAATRILDLLAVPTLPQPIHPQTPSGSHVVFDHVDFSYDQRTLVLNDVCLDLPEGSVTALVGASGSGKSTLASLVPRFYDVDSGSVQVGGVDVRKIASQDLYQQVGFVLQDVQLLNISVEDNIRLGRPEATNEEVRQAARLAQIDDRIEALPRGYQSVVGQDALFSGGEAQRVSIARAILADPPVLVLDEATAFADPESESRIQAALSQLIGGRTLLVIAHRLQSIAGADQIAVMDRGQIVEVGTHHDLLEKDGQYARMWNAYQGNAVGAGMKEAH